jgi:pimeloyl-ACP methyl ester carboxylesterase
MRFAADEGSVRIAYDVLGTGTATVMLHDFGESSGFWHEIGCVEACLAHGRQVVLVDLRGHGASSKPSDPTCYGPFIRTRDVVAVLDHAGIAQADFLGYGSGGRLALRMTTVARDRVHAVAAGGAHPFAERTEPCREALAKGLEPWVKLVEAKAGAISAGRRSRLRANEPEALRAAIAFDRPDMSDAVARSGVPILLFLGMNDPRYPLALSFAEQSGARVIGMPEHDFQSAAVAIPHILPGLLGFFDQPDRALPSEHPPMGLWSGCWS